MVCVKINAMMYQMKFVLQKTVKLTTYLSFFLLLACGEKAAIELENQTTKSEVKQNAITILALGDSLTEGLGVAKDQNYPALLEQKLKQKGHKNIKVVNSGLSGETSSGLKARIDWVLQTSPDITILTIGANDAMRGLPTDLMEQNIAEIIEKLQASGSKVILGGMQIYDNLGKKYVTEFNAIYTRLAAQYEVPLMPFFLDGVAGDSKLNQADGIHPTTEGYAVIVEQNILPKLLPLLEATAKAQK
ncbi:arylesterase [Marinicella rhabdoformis]|uniref:arylesterase n=1 Tax=Marinicella rhabdoformis TaxID=2580566 RepID=UPI001C55397E|nr:arylesterase [Marinicella rhabdoformis]